MLKESNRDFKVDENITVKINNSVKRAAIWNKRAKYFANLYKNTKGDKKIKCYFIIRRCTKETAKHLDVGHKLTIKILSEYHAERI